MSELKVQARECDSEPMVQIDDIRHSFSGRLKQAMSAKGIGEWGAGARLAKIAGVTPKAASKWLNGEAIPGAANLLAIAKELDVRREWLEYGEGAMMGEQDNPPIEALLTPISVWDDNTPLDDDEVEVPFLREVQLSAGSGMTVIEEVSKSKLRFGKYTLRRQGVEPANAVCVPVKGNSMEPILPDGSTVGVDKGATNIVDGKVYALKDDGMLRVKVLYRLPGGKVRLRSYNRDEYDDEERELAEIMIIGRVFWSSVLW
ncbi:HTH-type transcriptional regulator PrtR [compost metagenome]